MKRLLFKNMLIVGVALCWMACSNDNEPSTAKPILSVNEATNITQTSAKLSGRISANGSEIRECGFFYAEAVNDLSETSASTTKVPVNRTSDQVEAMLSDLKPETEYKYCLYASSGMSIIKSDIYTFKTANIEFPIVITDSIVAIGATWIRATGKITNTGSSSTITQKGFCFSATNLMPTTADKVVIVKDEDVFSALLGDLKPNTTYYVRAFASNDATTEVGYGKVVVVTTKEPSAISNDLPSVYFEEITDITTASFMTKALFKYVGDLDVIEVGFCWTTDSEESAEQAYKKNKVVGSLSDNNNFTAEVKGLEMSTTYYVFAYVTNEAGTAYSDQFIAVTQSIPTIDDIVSPEKK